MQKSHVLSALGLLLAVPSCSRNKPLSLHDTEGRTFSAKCDREGGCEISLVSGEHETPEKTAFALYSPGMLVAICDVVKAKAPESPSDCRPLTCGSDAECPPGHGLDHGTCINGLCHEAAVEAVAVEDAVMLCLSGTGLGTSKPDRMAMGMNCGAPCKVPSVCRQP